MVEKAPTLARVVNGWRMNTDTMGVYGNHYLKRAIIAQTGLGANQPEDAIYPLNVADADGKPATGDGHYVMHFTKEQLPPVGAFWSLTMHDAEGYQVANPLNRFAIGDRDALKYDADGSLDPDNPATLQKVPATDTPPVAVFRGPHLAPTPLQSSTTTK